MSNSAEEIAWPAGFEPTRAFVHAHNEILIRAEPDIVWEWLCRAAQWPAWYSNCGWFKFDSSSGPNLSLGTRFTWNTFGSTVHSTVRRFEPPLHLEWDASTIGIRAYHGWFIKPIGSSSLIVTEETQTGFLPFFFRWSLKRMLQRGHQTWLEGLRDMTARI